jgi:hypothetical protein
MAVKMGGGMNESGQGPPGKEGRMARQMERSMGGIKWNLDAWSSRYVEQRGATARQDMTRVLLAMTPQAATQITAEKPADWVRQLVADPAYQLK